MAGNFRGKGSRDIEKASETTIMAAGFTNNIGSRVNENSISGILKQQISDEDFDPVLEKKNKE